VVVAEQLPAIGEVWVPNSSCTAVTCGLAQRWPLSMITGCSGATALSHLLATRGVAVVRHPNCAGWSCGWPRRTPRGVTGASTVNLLGLATRLRRAPSGRSSSEPASTPHLAAMAPPGDNSCPPKRTAFSPPTFSASTRCCSSRCTCYSSRGTCHPPRPSPGDHGTSQRSVGRSASA
jgi:hypothetical protein